MIVVDTETPGGNKARFVCREDTSDAMLVRAVAGGDEYGLRDLPPLTGWAIDVGAHIGSVAITLALDNPYLNVVAVEPVPENRDILRQNIAINDLSGRGFTDERAAAGPYDPETVIVRYGDDEAHRYIGNLHAAGKTEIPVDAVSLEALMHTHGMHEVALLKIDCEGCEWGFLRDPTVARVRHIVGEYHGDPDELQELLGATHVLTIDTERFLFRAVIR